MFQYKAFGKILISSLVFLFMLFNAAQPMLVSKALSPANTNGSATFGIADAAYTESNFATTPTGGQQNYYLGQDFINGQYNKGLTRLYTRWNFGPGSLPANSVVTNASIYLYEYARSCTSNGTFNYVMYPVTTSWAGNTISWNNSPQLGGSIGSGSFPCVSSQWKQFNITSLAQQWFAGGTNYGVSFWGNPESASGVVFRSHTCNTSQCPGQEHPYLLVQYTIIDTPTPTITKTLTPTKTWTPTITATKSSTPTFTETPTDTSTVTETLTTTPTDTLTPTITETPTNTTTVIVVTETPTPTVTLTPNTTHTATPTTIATQTFTKTITPTLTTFKTLTLTPTITKSPTKTISKTPTPITYYSISGRITNSGGAGMSGVSVSDGAGHTVTTNSNGYYTINGLTTRAYTIKPSKNGYTFSPVSRAVSVPPNHPNQNFTGYVITYSISGRVTNSSGGGISGVAISDGAGHTATTDKNGNYTVSGLSQRSYTLVPSKSEYIFSPGSRSITVPPNQTNQNFTGQVKTYSISGRVTNANGGGISSVFIFDSKGHFAITDNNGNYSFNGLVAGTYTINPSKSGYTSPKNLSSRTVTLPGSKSGQDFKLYNRSPIVFVHGFRGFPPQLWGCNSSKYNQITAGEAKGYFNGTGDKLKSDGRYSDEEIVYARLVSNACYTPPLVSNVYYLKQAIQQAKDNTGQPKVILITHSMGGLVSRAYVEGSGYRGDVQALFTFGSPHLGAPTDVITFFFNGVSLGSVCQNLQPGACDFTTTGMSIFNRSHHKNGSIIYHVISGDAPWWTRSAAGIALDALIWGADDGIVPLDSGRAKNLGYFDRRTTGEVHVPMFGSNHYFASNSDSYRYCIKNILVYGNNNCGSVGWSSTSQTADSLPALTQHTPFETGVLLTGQTITRNISLEAGPTIFNAQWQNGTLALKLIAPNGQTIDPAFAAANPSVVTYVGDATGATYYFPNAITGTWQMALQAVNIPASGASFTTFAAFDSNITLTSTTNQDFYVPGANATITATLGGSPSSATITAKILRSDGVTDTLPLSPVGNGQYQASYVVPNTPGYTEVQVAASGTSASSLSFERAAPSLLFQISPSTYSLNNTYSTTPVSYSEIPFYQFLNVKVGISATIKGKVGLTADLVDAANNFVAHAMTIQDVASGPTNLTLQFDGTDIFASQHNGPYTLTNILLTDENGATLITQQAQAVYTTTAYSYKQFASPQTITLNSIGVQDGWILESSKTSGKGGTLKANATVLNVGDNIANKQYRGVLSFSTGVKLPDNAVITSVRLNLQLSKIIGGSDPMLKFQGLMVDVKRGSFGLPTLQVTDFQAVPNKSYGPFSPLLTSSGYTINLTNAKAYINKLATSNGLTQIRLRFKLDDNNNAFANYLSLYTGNAPVANRPQLIVQYYVP